MRRLVMLCVFSSIALMASIEVAFAWTPPSTAIIINRQSGMCIQTPAGSRQAGAPTEQYRCFDIARQRWDVQPIKSGFRIVNRSSGMCLQVANGSLAAGANVVQDLCGSKSRFRWKTIGKANSTQIVAEHSGQCLDVSDASIEDGATLVQHPCSASSSQRWRLSGGHLNSFWSEKIGLTLVPVAAAMLRTGKILAWSAHDRFAFGDDAGKTYTTIFDPATKTSTERLISSTGHDMFCPGTAQLPDGRILVNGGSSSDKTSIYDPATNTWATGETMNVARGYEGDTVLSTGEVLTVGGSWSGGLGGKIGEVWSPSGGWRKLPNVSGETLSGPDPAGLFRSDNHMWLFGVHGGVVFHAGPSAEMHWITTEGDGSIKSAGLRGADPYAMNGNVVMYDVGKILKVGGAEAYESKQASHAAYTIDFSGGPTATVKVVKQQDMAFPRALGNAVALPNGQVVVIGGQNFPAPFDDARSIMIPEIWSPATGGFERLSPMVVPRNYHSVALLMLDGRILAGGGGLCGDCDTNHPDVEILTPPYLLKSDGSEAKRPVISNAPKTAKPDDQIKVEVDRAVASFALVRLGAVTHSINNDQRRIPLTIVSSSSQNYQLRLPADRGTLIPGDWMLFALTGEGVPSVAKIVRIN